MIKTLSLAFALAATAFVDGAFCQSIDGTRFASISIRAILSAPFSDRRVARSMFWRQTASLTADERAAATASLVTMLKSGDAPTKLESADTLAEAKPFWATKNLSSDTTAVYQLFIETQDITLKNAVDSALANAQGLYRDGIDNYNSDNLEEVMPAGDKLKVMANSFPKSRYAENASFYVGQYFTKLFLLNDPRGKSLIDSSNAALENYISRAGNGEFSKTDFLAAGYYYRALNDLIVGNPQDAQVWLTKGAQKITNKDRVYVYQLFYTTDAKDTVADKFFPANAIFANTATYLQQNPNTTPAQQASMLSALSLNTQ